MGKLTALPQTPELVGRGLDAPSEEPHTRFQPLASIFGPSGLIRQPPNSLYSPAMVRGMDKSLTYKKAWC